MGQSRESPGRTITPPCHPARLPEQTGWNLGKRLINALNWNMSYMGGGGGGGGD